MNELQKLENIHFDLHVPPINLNITGKIYFISYQKFQNFNFTHKVRKIRTQDIFFISRLLIFDPFNFRLFFVDM